MQMNKKEKNGKTDYKSPIKEGDIIGFSFYYNIYYSN